MSSPIDPSLLPNYLTLPDTLILDIRPHAAYVSARIPRALSLSVPSTLLKRPLFSLHKLAAMLPSPAARSRFAAWHSASTILVYDADSVSAPDSSNIAGLLRKFKADDFQGELLWLRGGFQAVWRDHRHLLDTSPPSPDIPTEDDDDDDDDAAKATVLRPRHLPMAAFSLSSTTIHKNTAPQEIQNTAHPAYNPFFDTIRQNTELSHGITDRIPLRLPHRVRRRLGDLPFSWLQDIAKRAANAPRRHHLKSSITSSSSSSSESEDEESGARAAEIEEGKEALAMQFFKIELSEQRRMMGVMEHHSKESGQTVQQTFPYSITAGVEKGAKNRYRHIWPFEHARVRLHAGDDDDYINASYIQPLATSKRYIATQGPLPATFTDFWTLCWEQNVHVIVMLTREVEGAIVKCGTYWSDSRYGPLRLRLLSTDGLAKEDDRPSTAGFFANLAAYSVHPPPSSPPRLPHSADNHRRKHQHQHSKRAQTVKRVFELSNTAYPDAPPRKIIHLQYLEWPDMNVPDDPRGLLGLIKEVDEAVEEAQRTDQDAHPSESKKRRRKEPNEHEKGIDEKTGVVKHMLGANHPLLLHCSAGVGRTGGFIVVDAVLDAIRRELRSKSEDKMDVRPDSQEPFPTNDTGPSAPQNISPLAPTHTRHTATSTSTGSSETPHNGSSSSSASVTHTNGSYYYNSSSSVGTSVSETSSPSSSSFFKAGSSPPARDSAAAAAKMKMKRTAEMLHAALNHQQEQRLRTMSMPAPRPSVDARPERASTMQAKKIRMKMDMDVDVSDGDGEGSPPSRSQSPSADESAPTGSPSKLKASHSNSFSFSLSSPTAPAAAAAHQSTFDYKSPRVLHEDHTPPPLTAFDDPIWEVVQDVREQRMSLCQSLRQYVFVHAAVVEGALMVVDEERDRERIRAWGKKDVSAGQEGSGGGGIWIKSKSPTKRPLNSPIQARQQLRNGKSTHSYDHTLSSPFSSSSSRSNSNPNGLGKPDITHDTDIDFSANTPAENDDISHLLKRPSVKRKQRSGDDLSNVDTARYHPVPAIVASAGAGGGVLNAPSVPSIPSARSMPP